MEQRALGFGAAGGVLDGGWEFKIVRSTKGYSSGPVKE
jgi:hypothetical protein